MSTLINSRLCRANLIIIRVVPRWLLARRTKFPIDARVGNHGDLSTQHQYDALAVR